MRTFTEKKAFRLFDTLLKEHIPCSIERDDYDGEWFVFATYDSLDYVRLIKDRLSGWAGSATRWDGPVTPF